MVNFNFQPFQYLQMAFFAISNFAIKEKMNLLCRIGGLSQITFAFFGIFWPRTPLVCTFYVVIHTFFWPLTHPKCKRNFWKAPSAFDFCWSSYSLSNTLSVQNTYRLFWYIWLAHYPFRKMYHLNSISLIEVVMTVIHL